MPNNEKTKTCYLFFQNLFYKNTSIIVIFYSNTSMGEIKYLDFNFNLQFLNTKP